MSFRKRRIFVVALEGVNHEPFIVFQRLLWHLNYIWETGKKKKKQIVNFTHEDFRPFQLFKHELYSLSTPGWGNMTKRRLVRERRLGESHRKHHIQGNLNDLDMFILEKRRFTTVGER